MKTFDQMSFDDKMFTLRRWHAELPALLDEYLTIPLADIHDWPDYHIPWMISELEKLRGLVDSSDLEIAEALEKLK